MIVFLYLCMLCQHSVAAPIYRTEINNIYLGQDRVSVLRCLEERKISSQLYEDGSEYIQASLGESNLDDIFIWLEKERVIAVQGSIANFKGMLLLIDRPETDYIKMSPSSVEMSPLKPVSCVTTYKIFRYLSQDEDFSVALIRCTNEGQICWISHHFVLTTVRYLRPNQ